MELDHFVGRTQDSTCTCLCRGQGFVISNTMFFIKFLLLLFITIIYNIFELQGRSSKLTDPHPSKKLLPLLVTYFFDIGDHANC